MQGPGYDQESTPGLVAAGAQLVVFTTGRGHDHRQRHRAGHQAGVEHGHLRAHVATTSTCRAGGIIDGTATIDEVGARVFEHVRKVASGEVLACAEENKHREFQVWAEQSVSL